MKINCLKHAICFLKDEKGQAVVEYALLLFVLTLVSYGGINLFIEAWKNKFNKLKLMRAGALGMGP